MSVYIWIDPKPIFGHIDRIGDIKTEVEEGREFDLFITCDVSARETAWQLQRAALTMQRKQSVSIIM